MSRKSPVSLLTALLVALTCHSTLSPVTKGQSRDEADVTALMRAARDGERQNLKALLGQGVDINAKDSYGWTALIYAAAKGDSSAVKALLDKNADLNIKTDTGYTALHMAVQYCHSSVVKALVERGADVNQKVDSGTTALMLAASSGKSDIVKYLLAKGADVNASNDSGETALSFAQKTGKTDAAELIKKSGGIEKQVAKSSPTQAQADITKPVLINRPEPGYTTTAQKAGTEGAVRARVLVRSDGTVKRVRIISGLPYGLSYQAMDAAFQMRFKPATKDGQPTDFWLVVTVEFHIRK